MNYVRNDHITAAILREIIGNPWRNVTLPSRPMGDQVCVKCGRRWGKAASMCGDFACDGELRPSCPWLTHNDGAVAKIARVIYDSQQWDMMPMLADALEEAGCDNEEILRHCRGQERCPECGGNGLDTDMLVYTTASNPRCRYCAGSEVGWIPLRGPHARGCWVVDLLRGVE